MRRLAPLLLLVSALHGCASDPERPDVVLVVVDTLRADRMGCYGYERPTTPFLDGLAAEGALFTDVTAQFSWTVPSMVSMFTGEYLTDVAESVAPGRTTLAERFGAAGYRTIGASANVLLQEDTGLLAGFDHFSAVSESSTEERTLADLVDAGFAAIGDSDAPLFLYLHAFEPHDPYRRQSEAADALPTNVALPEELRARFEARLAPIADLAPDDDPDWQKELAWIARARARYDQEVRAVDLEIERLFERLAERGRLDETIFVLASDHGEGLWDHEPPTWIGAEAEEVPRKRSYLPRELFYQKHGAIQFQEVLATPLLLWGKGIAPRRVDVPVLNADIAPTLLELVDVAGDSTFDGRSLAPLLRGESFASRDFVFAGGVQGQSVRETATGLKLVVPVGKSLVNDEPARLYDLSEDPGELVDLAAERPADVERLLEAHAAWLRDNPTVDAGRGNAAERTAALRRRLSAIGYADEESIGD